MQGTLAAGKTTITKGIAQALGINETITSPTFCLISEYEGKMPLYHMDVYRLDGAEDFAITQFFIKAVGAQIFITPSLKELTLSGFNQLSKAVSPNSFFNWQQTCSHWSLIEKSSSYIACSAIFISCSVKITSKYPDMLAL